MKTRSLVLFLLLLSAFPALAGTNSSVIYETLAKLGLETWRETGGGYIGLHTFSCNYLFLKDINVKSHQCWYQAYNKDQIGPITDINNEEAATLLFDALKKTGLPTVSNNSKMRDWSQIDAPALECNLLIDHVYEPPKYTYSCGARQRLRN